MITKVGKQTLKEYETHQDLVQHLDKLRRLGLKPDEHIIGASGASVLHGMPIQNDDLDICISPEALQRIRRKLKAGPKDGVHDNNYQDRSGKVDISVSRPDNWFDWNQFYPKTIVVDGNRYLSRDGLLEFYEKLYSLSGKEKHLDRLNWLKENK